MQRPRNAKKDSSLAVLGATLARGQRAVKTKMKVSHSGLFQSLLPRLEHMGLDRRELLEMAGYSEVFSQEPGVGYIEDEPLIRAAIALSRDPLIAVKAIQLLPRNSSLAELAAAVEDVRSAIRVVYEFAFIASDRVVLELTEGHETSRLVHRTEQKNVHPLSQEWALASIVAFFREVTDGALRMDRLELKHAPRTEAVLYQKAFNLPVLFDCSENALVFPTSELGRPLVSANPNKVQALRAALELEVKRSSS